MKKIFPAIFVFLIAAIFSSCKSTEPLGVNLVYQADYTAEDGSLVSAEFYSLSDDSLSFVKLHIGEETLTLTRAVSASGDRYVDEMQKTEFWAKGTSAFIEKLDIDGNGTETTINLAE